MQEICKRKESEEIFMKLIDFIMMVKKRKKLFLFSIVISFVAMLIFTVFLNNVDYQISATIKLDGNVLLTSSTMENKSDKIYNQVELKLKELDDQSAVEYIQNNKNFYDDSKIIDYSQVVTDINSSEFMYAQINSYSFKQYLIEKDIISNFKQINIVEQTESLNIRVTADSTQKTEKTFNKVLEAIPMYVQKVINEKVEVANKSIKSSIKNDEKQIDELINKYDDLKKNTEFANIKDLNNGVEILNSLSRVSYNINENNSISSKFDRLLSSDIKPYLILKRADLTGLKLSKTLLSYIIIEVISSILVGFLVAFIAECHSRVKMLSKKQ